MFSLDRVVGVDSQRVKSLEFFRFAISTQLTRVLTTRAELSQLGLAVKGAASDSPHPAEMPSRGLFLT